MTESEAKQALAVLVAGFPGGKWDKPTLALYLGRLARLDREKASRAIDRTIDTCKYPHPQLAEILEHAGFVDPRIAERESRQLEGRPNSGAYRCVNQDEVDAFRAGKLLPGPRLPMTHLPMTAAALSAVERSLARVPVRDIPEPPRESEVHAEAERNRHRFREWCRANGEPVPGDEP